MGRERVPASVQKAGGRAVQVAPDCIRSAGDYTRIVHLADAESDHRTEEQDKRGSAPKDMVIGFV
jgi:hypothetical protein